MTPLLPPRDAAALLGLSERTLERHRVAGTGPVFLKIGRRVAYRESDLQTYLDRCARQSTSEDDPR